MTFDANNCNFISDAFSNRIFKGSFDQNFTIKVNK